MKNSGRISLAPFIHLKIKYPLRHSVLFKTVIFHFELTHTNMDESDRWSWDQSSQKGCKCLNYQCQQIWFGTLVSTIDWFDNKWYLSFKHIQQKLSHVVHVTLISHSYKYSGQYFNINHLCNSCPWWKQNTTLPSTNAKYL